MSYALRSVCLSAIVAVQGPTRAGRKTNNKSRSLIDPAFLLQCSSLRLGLAVGDFSGAGYRLARQSPATAFKTAFHKFNTPDSLAVNRDVDLPATRAQIFSENFYDLYISKSFSRRKFSSRSRNASRGIWMTSSRIESFAFALLTVSCVP